MSRKKYIYFNFTGQYSLNEIICPIKGVVKQETGMLILDDEAFSDGSFFEGFYGSVFKEDTEKPATVKGMMQAQENVLTAAQFTVFPNNEKPVMLILKCNGINIDTNELEFTGFKERGLKEGRSVRYADNAKITVKYIEEAKVIKQADELVKTAIEIVKPCTKHIVENNRYTILKIQAINRTEYYRQEALKKEQEARKSNKTSQKNNTDII